MQTLDLGKKSYVETLALQKKLLEERALLQVSDTLILVEHDPVFTTGRATASDLKNETGDDKNLLTTGKAIYVPKLGNVPVVEVERGGKLTFHGPGQLVGYPIFMLTDKDLRKYLRNMERVLMQSILKVTGLSAKPGPETLFLEPGQLQTGIWIGDKKIASIGIAVRKWVSFHGFALNLSTDLRYFEAVEPCGFSGQIMTSLLNEVKAKHGKISDKDFAELCHQLKAELVAKFSEMSSRYADVAKERANVLESALTDAIPEVS